MSRYKIGFGVTAVALLVLLLPAAIFFRPESYSAYSSGVQAVGVVLTLYVAVATLSRDSRDGRVDRVLGLHSELVGGSTGAARSRLGRWVRGNDMRRVSRRGLQEAATSVSVTGAEEERYDDLHALLRLFERIEGARASGALEPDSAVLLLGSHAAWWDRAIEWDDTLGRRYLHDFSTWCRQHAARRTSDSRFTTWNEADRDFPDIDPDTLHRTGGRS